MHLVAAQQLLAWFPSDSTVYRRFVLPFFEDFWRVHFADARFLFRAPAAVDEALAAARQLPDQDRLRAILRAVHIGVRVRGVERQLSWLSSGDTATQASSDQSSSSVA